MAGEEQSMYPDVSQVLPHGPVADMVRTGMKWGHSFTVPITHNKGTHLEMTSIRCTNPGCNEYIHETRPGTNIWSGGAAWRPCQDNRRPNGLSPSQAMTQSTAAGHDQGPWEEDPDVRGSYRSKCANCGKYSLFYSPQLDHTVRGNSFRLEHAGEVDECPAGKQARELLPLHEGLQRIKSQGHDPDFTEGPGETVVMRCKKCGGTAVHHKGENGISRSGITASICDDTQTPPKLTTDKWLK